MNAVAYHEHVAALFEARVPKSHVLQENANCGKSFTHDYVRSRFRYFRQDGVKRAIVVFTNRHDNITATPEDGFKAIMYALTDLWQPQEHEGWNEYDLQVLLEAVSNR
jgi:hypothetical protein